MDHHQEADTARPAGLGAPPPLWVYGAIVFAAAWLVFWVQPLAVRRILPVLGGSPAVWNTAMVFFQSALLGGYATAHLLVHRTSPRVQLAILGLLWTAVAIATPVGDLRIVGEAPDEFAPAVWLLATLGGTLGLAFVTAASLTPLVQAWLARAGAGAASADPYFLYSASNSGSCAALLAYPFLLEPLLSLRQQEWIWSATLLGLAPFVFVLWRASTRGQGENTRTTVEASYQPGTLPVMRIIALSAVPSALLLALTGYLTTDIAAVPLLWIVPLVLYLGTFVHAFARRKLIAQHIVTRLVAPALIFLAVLYPIFRTILVFGFVHLVVFTIAALYCHGALSRLRPRATDLTRFYLLISTGGLIGGFLVALIAPLVFTEIYEYPITLAVTAALIPATGMTLSRTQIIIALTAFASVISALAAIHGYAGHSDVDFSTLTVQANLLGMALVVVLGAPALLMLRAKPKLLAGALLAIMLVPTWISPRNELLIAHERTFFGVYRVVESNGIRSFQHGTTLHGAQWTRADGSIESRTTYYGIGTPYFELFSSLTRRPSPVTIALAGLGTGSLACYARPEDEVHIYEIDPTVARLARTHFAALHSCAPNARVSIGDARLALERETEPFDLLALDTFASDAIPVHLLTVEAFETYLRVLAPQGVIGVHISNRHLDLEPVLAALAEQMGLAGRIKRYRAPKEEERLRVTSSSDVVVLAREENVLQALDLDAGWVALGSPDQVRVWTDDYTSIVPVVRWR